MLRGEYHTGGRSDLYHRGSEDGESHDVTGEGLEQRGISVIGHNH